MPLPLAWRMAGVLPPLHRAETMASGLNHLNQCYPAAGGGFNVGDEHRRIEFCYVVEFCFEVGRGDTPAMAFQQERYLMAGMAVL